MKTWPRTWWQRVWDWVMGRKWTIGVDPGTGENYSAIVACYLDRKGIIHVEEVCTRKPSKKGDSNAD